MYYSITKRIMKTALGFLILVCAFAFAFFIIHFGNETESFDSVGKSFLKTLVMVLGEFEFDDLWINSERSTSEGDRRWLEASLSRLFTMLLLVGLIILGSMIMVNLIVVIFLNTQHIHFCIYYGRHIMLFRFTLYALSFSASLRKYLTGNKMGEFVEDTRFANKF